MLHLGLVMVGRVARCFGDVIEQIVVVVLTVSVAERGGGRQRFSLFFKTLLLLMFGRDATVVAHVWVGGGFFTFLNRNNINTNEN